MKQRPHILFISSWYPTEEQPFLGNFVLRHAELISRSYMVTVLHLKADRGTSKFTHTHRQNGSLQEITVRYPDTKNPVAKWRNAKKAFRQAAEQIYGVDLIHGHVILSKGLQFVWAKKYFGKPLIVSEHASYYREAMRRKWSFKDKLTLRKVISAADRLTAVSPLLKAEMQQAFPGIEIDILPNVIDPEVFAFKDKIPGDIPQFIHVSTLDERYKNISGILTACALLKSEKGPAFRLDIISDEPYGQLQQKAAGMDLADCVHFSGPMQPGDIARAMQQADAFVLFSSYETFSIVIAEAWATGTPVISTPVGIARALDPAYGVQVGIDDPESLKNAMKQWIEKQVSFDQQTIAARAAQYAPAQVLETIGQLYEKLL